VGHEYWLRNLKSMTQDGSVIRGNFTYPDAAGDAKTVTNTFLWDYYYENTVLHDHRDKNQDIYQTYYNSARTYASYPLLTKGTPYILGLPGSIYYEFDLSGTFVPQNTAVAADSWPRLEKQTVTFASAPGITIGVSDKEMQEVSKTVDGHKYAYRPSYMNETFTAADNAYAMNNGGNAYNIITASTKVGAFRPYFIVTTVPTPSRPVTRSIVFAGDEPNEPYGPNTQEADKPGTIHVSAGKHKVIVKSTLKTTATVQITSTSGITLTTFAIEPGETIETRVSLSGVYIVQTTDGEHTTKIAVR
jgi:hypothetical protein